MKTTEIKSILTYLVGAIPIGIGTTAICFLMPNGKVLKLYMNTYLKRELFYYHDMRKHLEFLNNISNESYIGPEELLIKNDEVIGYIYTYINGLELKRLKNNIRLNDIVKGYENLYNDTLKISNNKFRLNDLHQKNILFNGNYYVIDLDKGYVDNKDNKKIFDINITNINNNIINSIFDLNFFEHLSFYDDDLDKLFYSSLYENHEDFYELLEKLFYNGITKKDVKEKIRIYVHKKDPDYYRVI